MTPHDPRSDDGPELVPPAELLRLRQILRREPASAVRAQHLAATTSAARQRFGSGPMGRFASRGARTAVAVVASLVITSGLAGAQLLPQPAQRLLSNVSDRFAPNDDSPDDAPPATAVEAGDGSTTTTPRTDRRPTGTDAGTSDASTLATDTDATTPTTARPTAPTSTTIPGPTGPGSPDDPADPGTTTTSSTTTTTVPGSTTTTTDPGSTTTTTEAPSP
jgi:hypothetical protein